VATSSLLALLDDIATILDDVALMTKVAAKKTAGVLGDDLALNAQQVTGVRADRELPVVWAVAKGSVRNKLILVPAALAISALAPWAVTPLLMIGGAYLCFEGVEKLAHRLLHRKEEDEGHRAELLKVAADPAKDLVAFEKEKVAGAVRTDFILSAEIITIALGTVATAPFGSRVAVLLLVSAVMTAGVYGLVAGIVKIDDAGLYLSRLEGPSPWRRVARRLGLGMAGAAPWLMKTLSVVGTAAMFLVGGGILAHGVPGAEHVIHQVTEVAGAVPVAGGALAWLAPLLLDAVLGMLVGAVVLAGWTAISRTVGALKRSK
jgi:hypothetical protein